LSAARIDNALSPEDPVFLNPTKILDCDHPDVQRFAASATDGAGDNPVDCAVHLYLAVRDGIHYDPYGPFYRPEHYQASRVLSTRRGFCIGKAGLLCAAGRACGIPARLGFATVRNHLATRQLIDFLGTDRFVFHGYTEFYLEGKWVKATPAFNAALCRRHGVSPLAFNGREDSIFQPYNQDNQKYMEYVADHGIYWDIPVDAIAAAWREVYGQERVERWITELERTGGRSLRDFAKESVLR